MGEGVLGCGFIRLPPRGWGLGGGMGRGRRRRATVGREEGEGAVLGEVEGQCGWREIGHGRRVFGK